jgi:Amt family ammonium transporter
MMGLFGFLMIAFVAQTGFSAASGGANLPNGLLFGGGLAALRQLEVQALAVVVVAAFVFSLSYIALWTIGKFTNGITTDYDKSFTRTVTMDTPSNPIAAISGTREGKK